MFVRRFSGSLVVLLVTSLAGCTSFSSVLLHRGESNMGWEREKHLHGVPITLKVPTHVRVDVLAKHMFFLNDGVVQRDATQFPIREVTYDFIETEKIFTVDVKRPAAGTLNTTIDLDADNQYIKSITKQLTDRTISDVSALIAAVAPGGLIGAPTSEGNVSVELMQRVKEVTSVIASQVFEVDSPEFEVQVMTFLDRHLNCCHDCGVLPNNSQPPQRLPGKDQYTSKAVKLVDGAPAETVVLDEVVPTAESSFVLPAPALDASTWTSE